MTMRYAYDPETYYEDLRVLIEHRGMTVEQAAAEVGMSRRTAFRILARERAARRR